MRLHSWLLAILGFAALLAASLPLWPPSLGLHAPSGGEVAALAALGVGCLAIAGYFTRRDRRDSATAQTAAREAVAGELAASGVIADFVESTRIGCLRLEATPDGGGSDAFASKLGGVFYSPPGFAWPLTTEQQPMWPLAQLNFAELPHLDGFPDRGILQFFITGDDLYGMDFDDQTRQSGFRVVYHPEVGDLSFPNPDQPEPAQLTVPFTRSHRISATPATMPMTVSDWRFEEAISQSWWRCTGAEPGPEMVRAAADLLLDATDEAPFAGHQLGGHPFFTQDDPRGYTEGLRGHTTVLLQIDSVGDICWGDVGVACFLIEPERLSRGDFSNVLYTWDCH